jgi:transcriptional regulator with XRE-family HTH domain
MSPAMSSQERLAKLPPEVTARRRAFAKAVRDRRKELGLSQDDVAERAGCERQSINRFENVKFSPSLDSVWKIAEALELSVADLMAVVLANLEAAADVSH